MFRRLGTMYCQSKNPVIWLTKRIVDYNLGMSFARLDMIWDLSWILIYHLNLVSHWLKVKINGNFFTRHKTYHWAILAYFPLKFPKSYFFLVTFQPLRPLNRMSWKLPSPQWFCKLFISNLGSVFLQAGFHHIKNSPLICKANWFLYKRDLPSWKS